MFNHAPFVLYKELKRNKEQDEVIEEIVQIAENKKKRRMTNINTKPNEM